MIASEQLLMDRFDEALSACHSAAQMDPGEGQPYLLMGTIYLKKGDLKNAETSLKKAADIARQNEDDFTLYQAETLLKQIQR